MDLQPYGTGLLSYPDPQDFDFGAFLQTDDINFGESAQGQSSAAAFSDSSATGKATPPSSDNRSSSIGSTEVVRRPAQKQRLERRGHTKSRRGCYNCKRRRIKVIEF